MTFGANPFGGAPFGESSLADAGVSVSDSLVFATFVEAEAYFTLNDVLLTNDAAAGEILPWIRDRVLFASSAAGWRSRMAALTDSFGLNDDIHIVLAAFAADSLSLTDSSAGYLRRVAEVVDILRATGAASGLLAAMAAVVDALTMREVMRVAHDASVTDALTMSEDWSALVAARAAVVESVVLGDSATGFLGLLALVEDSIDFEDSADGIRTLLATASDSIVVYATVRVGGNSYSGWVLNTANKAASTYGFNFNSMFSMGGSLYGVSDDGIFLMEGDDDDGTAIEAKVLTGATDFGTGRQKRMPSIYLGYTADGPVFVRVVTYDAATGERYEDDYPLNVATRPSPASGRAKLGRGLKSVYWQAGLENSAGSDFTIGDVTLFPLILDRRL